MGKYIATEACVLACQNPLATAVIQVTGINSYKVTSGSSKVWAKQIDFRISTYSISSTGFTQSNPTSGSITATATSVTTTSVTTSENAVVLEGDQSATLTISGMIGQNNAEVTDVVYVKSAGQKVVKAT